MSPRLILEALALYELIVLAGETMGRGTKSARPARSAATRSLSSREPCAPVEKKVIIYSVGKCLAKTRNRTQKRRRARRRREKTVNAAVGGTGNDGDG